MKKNKRKLKYKIIVFFILLICLINSFGKINKFCINLIYKKDYSEYVEKYASIYNVDKNLVYAIIKNESNFNSDAVSPVGAMGLMQVMKSTAEDVAKELEIEEYNLFLPEDNIKIGTKYISDLKQKYNDDKLVIAAYNAGFGNVDDWVNKGIIKLDGSDYENIPFKETNLYVRKVIRDYEFYKTKMS